MVMSKARIPKSHFIKIKKGRQHRIETSAFVMLSLLCFLKWCHTVDHSRHHHVRWGEKMKQRHQIYWSTATPPFLQADVDWYAQSFMKSFWSKKGKVLALLPMPLEPTFQEKYSQVAWSGKHSEYTVTRFIFQNLVLLKICSFLGYTSSLTPNIA